MRATGLGLVKSALNPPGVDRFHESPPAEVNSPVSVFFNGVELPVTRKVGWPDEINVYRLEFRVPADATPSPVTLQLVNAWILGSPVTIRVQ